MVREFELRRRDDLRQKTDEMKELTNEQEEAMGIAADDHDIVGDTLGSLERGMTEEGMEEVESAIESAGDAADEDFWEHDHELEELHSEGDEWSAELDEREQSGESDQDTVEGAESDAALEQVKEEILGALEAIRDEIALLREESDRHTENQQESKEHEAELRIRIETGDE